MLFISLVSVQKITSQIPYKIELDEINDFSCDKVQGWRIGPARVHDRFYYPPTSEAIRSSMKPVVTAAMQTSDVKDKAWLFHDRLGHPSFQTLDWMFPDVFKGDV